MRVAALSATTRPEKDVGYDGPRRSRIGEHGVETIRPLGRIDLLPRTPEPSAEHEPPRRERRYPPTPYAPRSAATLAYRDAYDLGWRHYASVPGDMILRHDAGLRADSPEQHGYRDGVTARFVLEEKAERFAREMAKRDRAQLREERRRWGQQEAPY